MDWIGGRCEFHGLGSRLWAMSIGLELNIKGGRIIHDGAEEVG